MTDDSGSLSRIDSVGKETDEIIDRSWVVNTVRTLGVCTSSFVQESYCYRWLTKEPDPEIIVIDLRETYTVGPVITLLDKLIPRIEDAWQHSKVGSIARRAFERLASDMFDPLSETGGYEFAAALLTPPEPPEQARAGDDESESTEDNLS